ncbi:MAG: tRNA (adenosine(37)-N6)-dimethylallyltransferase MiaA [Candidatus Acidiferrales bacterium]
MQNPVASLPLIAVVGPTAAGKSALGVFLAEQLGGEVVACDSTQLYRGFDIGTAKPTLGERRGIPHHLLDVLQPEEESTAGGYRRMALEVLEDLHRRGRLPVFTVGTGLYLRALLEGLADAPGRSDELRKRLRVSASRHASGHLHRLLVRLDPEAAAHIAAGDEQKLIRAIEVCLLSRRPLSDVHRAGRTPLVGWNALKIGLLPPREALYARIRARVDAMLERGWLAEVQRLLAAGLPGDAKPFDFIGYRELRAHLRGELSLEEAAATIAQATRRYAKRQMTWFRRESGVHWLETFGDEPAAQQAALAWVRKQSTGAAPACPKGV